MPTKRLKCGACRLLFSLPLEAVPLPPPEPEPPERGAWEADVAEEAAEATEGAGAAASLERYECMGLLLYSDLMLATGLYSDLIIGIVALPPLSLALVLVLVPPLVPLLLLLLLLLLMQLLLLLLR